MSESKDLMACLAGAEWHPGTMAWLLVALALSIVSVMVALERGRPFPGQRWLLGVQACAAIWLMIAALAAACEPACQRPFVALQRPAMLGVSALWLAFIVQYAGSRLGAIPRWCRALAIMPFVTLSAIALTDGWHGMFFGQWVVNSRGIGEHQFGPGSFVARAWAYGMLGGAVLIILSQWQKSAAEDRATWVGFLAACVIPWAVLIGHQAWGWSIEGHDPTPLGLTSLFAVCVTLAHGRRAFDLSPHATKILFTEIGDALVVIDNGRVVVQCNPATQKIGNAPCHRGTPLRCWTPWGTLLEPLCNGKASSTLLAAPGQGSRVEAAVHPIRRGSEVVGHLVHLHDVTDLAQAREALADALRLREEALRSLQVRQAQLVDDSLRDPLTGLLNRRALQGRFAEDATHAERTGLPLTLAMIDIDHFKRVNDTLGHAAGDEVLRRLATHLTQGVRSGDSVFRIGGEEFVVLLPGASLDRARRRMEKLRDEFAAASVLPSRCGHVTFSAGLAQVSRESHGLDEVLLQADEALYRAKAEGRNCVRPAATQIGSS